MFERTQADFLLVIVLCQRVEDVRIRLADFQLPEENALPPLDRFSGELSIVRDALVHPITAIHRVVVVVDYDWHVNLLSVLPGDSDVPHNGLGGDKQTWFTSLLISPCHTEDVVCFAPVALGFTMVKLQCFEFWGSFSC